MLLLLASWTGAIFSPVYAAIPAEERDALIDFYVSTDGLNWLDTSGWLGDEGTECTWLGVICDEGETHVKGIDLWQNNLEGQIPGTIASLSFLEELYLSDNQLFGSVPPELGSLLNLKLLWLNGNQLSGPVPSELLNLTELEDQASDLRYNALYTDDEGLRNFLNTKQIDGDWESTQTVAPTNLKPIETATDAVALEWTPIAYIQGPGGYEIWYATSSGGDYTLIGTTADKNVGNISIKNLKPETAYYFRIRTKTEGTLNNANTLYSEYTDEMSVITDSIPSDIPEEQRNALIELYTSTNGSDWLDNTGWLGDEGSECSWEGVICNDDRTSVLEIDLYENHLVGRIPASIANFSDLEGLYLNGNQLSGPIPPELGSLSALAILWLNNNLFEGPVPAEITGLVNLEDDGGLDLRYNALYTSDEDLRDFLTRKQYEGDWESFQTVAPSDVEIIERSTDSVSLQWTRPLYTEGPGAYEIWYADEPEGDYTLIGTTRDKTVERIIIKNLKPETTYYFRLRTVTIIDEFTGLSLNSNYTDPFMAITRSDAVHSADYNSDFRIDLSELLRFIQLYNSREYCCKSGTEDGFAPGEGDRNCNAHNGDYNPSDWHISLSELLRVIQFYNYTKYHKDETAEDGFTPGK